jgi:altronate dehydratase small subunit
MQSKAIILNAKDNVATVLTSLVADSEVQLSVSVSALRVKLRSDIPFGHKFSLVTIEKGQPVIKYGEVIGVATSTIPPGEHVHVHNVVSTRGRGQKGRE